MDESGLENDLPAKELAWLVFQGAAALTVILAIGVGIGIWISDLL